MDKYEGLIRLHQQDHSDLNRRYNNLSAIRLLIVIGFCLSFYQYYHSGTPLLLAPLILLPAVFLFILKIHQGISDEKKLKKALISLNENEISHLKYDKLPFDNGKEFTNTTHLYSYDLDVFGEKSLFQNLNRTGTHVGKTRLANHLLQKLSNEEISATQEAIKELRDKVEWRQHLLAQAMVKPDTKESYENLLEWSRSATTRIPTFINIASRISPVVTVLCFILYFLTPMGYFGNFGLLMVLLNLALIGTQFRNIRNEIISSGEIDKILRQYSLIMKEVEELSAKNSLLNQLRDQLHFEDLLASKKISRLSSLFTKLDHIQNIYAGPIFNGLFLYHIHVLRSLYRWRAECRHILSDWLNVIGEIETLNSLANFSYNNPDFVFPELNNQQEISFENLGHPLISQRARVTNSVSFLPHQFFILTGSNMSGKSTFLRTLGINMVLANTGSVVCATHAVIHPLPVLVSMRLSDSLSDSESYFFAEVKRLKEIMNTQDEDSCFVLLDEILRGTNSDDKRTGTIEVIRKMVAKQATGVIATHDLEVCKIAKEHPDTLENKRFEVEIINNELVFDYKLRDGVCENKSATFLMKKMKVI